MEIVTGYVGEPHITSEKDRMLYRAIFGNYSVITCIGKKLEPELISNNEIRIRDGGLVQQGCFAIIPAGTYDVLNIQNGRQGMKRIDLIVSRYEKNADTGIERVMLKVLQGTDSPTKPVKPSNVVGNIASGDLVDEFVLYAVNIDGLNITSIDKIEKPIFSMAEAIYARKEF